MVATAWRIMLGQYPEIDPSSPQSWIDADVSAPLPCIVIPRRIHPPPLHHLSLALIPSQATLATLTKATMTGTEHVNLHALDATAEELLRRQGKLPCVDAKAVLYLNEKRLLPELANLTWR